MLQPFDPEATFDQLFFGPLYQPLIKSERQRPFHQPKFGIESLSENFNISSKEDNENVYLAFSVPGFDPDKINLSLDHKNSLNVSAESPDPLYPEKTKKINQSYKLNFQPKLNNCSSTLVNGILKVTIPKHVDPPIESSHNIPITYNK